MSEIAAYHEAGHALMAVRLGAEVESVTVDPDWDDGPKRFGDTRIAWPEGQFDQRELHRRAVLVALAGPVAEMHYSGDPYHPGFVAEWSADWQLAWEAAALLFADQRQRLEFLERTTIEVYRLLDDPDYWAAVAALADELLAHETLEAQDVQDVVRQWLSQ